MYIVIIADKPILNELIFRKSVITPYEVYGLYYCETFEIMQN